MSMASAIFPPLQTSCYSLRSIKKKYSVARPRNCSRAEQTSHVVSWGIESQKTPQQEKDLAKPGISDLGLKGVKGRQTQEKEESSFAPKFEDERWKNGNWDLNMFVKDGKIDWDAMIVAGQAAMLGFFMAYLVDSLTGLGVVGRTSNFICKVFLLAVVTGIILFRENKDLTNLIKLVEQATHYDKQWRSSWQDEKGNMSNPDQGPQ